MYLLEFWKITNRRISQVYITLQLHELEIERICYTHTHTTYVHLNAKSHEIAIWKISRVAHTSLRKLLWFRNGIELFIWHVLHPVVKLNQSLPGKRYIRLFNDNLQVFMHFTYINDDGMLRNDNVLSHLAPIVCIGLNNIVDNSSTWFSLLDSQIWTALGLSGIW